MITGTLIASKQPTTTSSSVLKTNLSAAIQPSKVIAIVPSTCSKRVTAW
jgi:hypothetical protein